MKKQQTVLSVTAKCSDLYSHVLHRSDGKKVVYDGYVPSFFPEDHFGDYLILDIDPYTGTILNWNKWKRAKKSKTKRGAK